MFFSVVKYDRSSVIILWQSILVLNYQAIQLVGNAHNKSKKIK